MRSCYYDYKNIMITSLRLVVCAAASRLVGTTDLPRSQNNYVEL